MTVAVRLKTDENLPVEAAEMLRAPDHDAVSVFDQRLRGAKDSELALICVREQRALTTLDTDFVDEVLSLQLDWIKTPIVR